MTYSLTREQFLDALESGKYIKATGTTLEVDVNGNICHCALGVAMAEAGIKYKEEKIEWEDHLFRKRSRTQITWDLKDEDWEEDSRFSFIPDDLALSLEIDVEEEDFIWNENDADQKESFIDLAKKLRERWNIPKV